MKDIINRIQDWYKLNCNGDWEHAYGWTITTIDNPGWAITIDLSETALENLNYKREHQNPKNDNDWFQMHTENKTLTIYCGPENMKLALEIFFDELIPRFADKNFKYDIYLPVDGCEINLWTPAKSRLVDERNLEITEIDKIEYRNLKFRDIETINFVSTEVDKIRTRYEVGDILEVVIEKVYDGLILAAKSRSQ